MALSIQPYKGARDFYPEDKRIQKWMFDVMRRTVERFGYQEYDAPLLEPLEIYQAKTGDEIVNEQTYVFEDRGGRKVVVRPEMTPSVSRMVAGRRQEFAYPLRLYNIGSRWRYERPQRGRNREFFQLDVDLFGVEGIEGDAEIIQIADSLMKAFGAKSGMYEIRFNSRKLFSRLCTNYLGLDKDAILSLSKIVDKLSKITKDEFTDLYQKALSGVDDKQKVAALKDYFLSPSWDNVPASFIKDESLKELQKLRRICGESSINLKFDPSVVRGLDYYTDVVFEVYDLNPENNRSMFGGGRYDGLVGMFGVEPIPTVGFAMGDVTLFNFLETNKLLPKINPGTEAVAILIGDVYEKALPILEKLRQKLNVAVDFSDRKLDKKIQAAEKAGVDQVIFIGEEEVKSGKLRLKNLQSGQEQTMTAEEIIK